MKSSIELEKIATELLEPKGFRLLSCTPIQSLWAGYGHICRLEALIARNLEVDPSASNSKPQSLILKYVQPPTKVKPSKSQAPDEGHLRKVLSYQVEQYFYTHLVPQMPSTIGVASCISSINSTQESTTVTAMVMTNLREQYPVAGEKVVELSDIQVDAALSWLAGFHGFWWNKIDEVRGGLVLPPLEHFAERASAALGEQDTVWLNGGYTYLATRNTEFVGLARSDSEWSSALCEPITEGGPNVAELVAQFLSSSTNLDATISTSASSRSYQTLLHGDVKSENFFTSADGKSVAFYDFQYVGLGFGACDLAKLLTCSVPLNLLVDEADEIYRGSELTMQQGERKLLQKYLSRLSQISEKEHEWNLFLRHWETALVDWLRFQASWGFWGNTEWLEARVRSILADGRWIEWLKSVVGC